jgi:hypothetical protein
LRTIFKPDKLRVQEVGSTDQKAAIYFLLPLKEKAGNADT